MDWFLKAMTTNYFNFKDRARREEYWMFFLMNIVVGFFLGLAISLLKLPSLLPIYQLATLIPSIALGVRRMHDTNKSGWFILIPIYNLILLLREGDATENRFGPDPKARERAQANGIRKTG